MKYITAFFCMIFFLSAAEPLSATITKPTWASDFGQDQYGIWADMQVTGVTQRFRWIKPGTFTTGSSQSEKELVIKNAAPPAVNVPSPHTWLKHEVQHEVRITKGYWLADTECTQELWKIVTGINPSSFKDPKNPVENVSWIDCQKFFNKLNQQVTGAKFGLPTNAEWEYACRAGTTAAFNFGDIITTDQVNYNPNKQTYGRPKIGRDLVFRKETVAVKSLPANAWGMHGMHGNVSEICDYNDDDNPTNTISATTGHLSGRSMKSTCSIRGGSWILSADQCRSASRNIIGQGNHSDRIGFRFIAQSAP